jgi:MOSC domain-containing protein YiiM
MDEHRGHAPHIFQLNRSAGGVPKLPVMEAQVSSDGLEGDKQRNRRFHGGPNRALCLFSLEMILELQAAGHPVHPGSMGENVTLAGINLAVLELGDTLAFGDEVVVQITSYAHPCQNIAGSFADGDITRVSQKVYPGKSRLYARVLQGGALRAGLPVRVLGHAAGDRFVE